MLGVDLKDFHPFNTWTVEDTYIRNKYKDKNSGEDVINRNKELFNMITWRNTKEPAFIIDETTGRKYLSESKNIIRFKCALLALGTPILQSVISLLNVVYRIVKLVSLSHFWFPKGGETSYSFKGRLKDAGEDALRFSLLLWPSSLLKPPLFMELSNPMMEENYITLSKGLCMKQLSSLLVFNPMLLAIYLEETLMRKMHFN